MTAIIIIITISYDHSPAPEGNSRIPERLLKDGRKMRVLLSTGLVGRNPGLPTFHYIMSILAFNVKLGLPPSFFSVLNTHQESTLAQYFALH